MAPRKHEDVLRRYNGELNRSIAWRRDTDRDQLWKRMVNLYEGKHYDGDATNDRMVVARAFAVKNVMAPSVAVNNPKFVVQSRQPQNAPHAVITQEVLNYLWRTYKYRREFRLAVDDYLVVGHGWLKVGYKFKKEAVVKDADLPEEKGDVDTEPGVDDRENHEGNTETEKRFHVAEDRAFVERISFYDVFVDPDARHLGEARWIAQRTKRPVADVRVDGRYIPKHRVEAQAVERDSYDPSVSEADLKQNGNSKGFVDVWEYYDLREGTVCTFMQGYNEGFLIAPKPMPYAFGHPFIMLRNYEVNDKFYPIGELEQIEALQHELNATRTEMMHHRRGNQRKYKVKEDALADNESWEALKSNEDGAVVKMAASAEMSDAALFDTHTISADAYNMSEIIENDIDDITGVTDFTQTAIRRTATEAAMIQDQMNSRSADKLGQIEETLAEIGERLIQLMQQFMTSDQVVRVVGSQSMPTWIHYDRHWIAGQFDFEVQGGSTQPNNESSMRQSAMQFTEAMSPFIQLGVVDPIAVARKVLSMFGEKDPGSFLAEQEEMVDPNEDPNADPNAPQGPPGVPQSQVEGPPQMGEDPEAIAGIPNALLNRTMAGPSPVMSG